MKIIFAFFACNMLITFPVFALDNYEINLNRQEQRNQQNIDQMARDGRIDPMKDIEMSQENKENMEQKREEHNQLLQQQEEINELRGRTE